MVTIHTGEIELMLCEEAHFHEDYENEIKNIPIVGAKIRIYKVQDQDKDKNKDKDKRTLLYDNTANDQGKIEFSNSEIKDGEIKLYIELEHPDFDKEPIGGHVFLRKGLEKQKNPIYFRRTKLRLKHAPFEKLQTPKEFREALEMGHAEGKKTQKEDEELSQDWDSLKTKAEELLERNKAIIEKTYDKEMKKAEEQLQRATTKEEEDKINEKIKKIEADKEAKNERHDKQKNALEEIVKDKDIKALKNFINTRAGADYAEWVVSFALLRHAPHLYHQRINADGIFEDNIGQTGSDPDFLITLEDKKRMIVEVKNYAYSSALNLTDQISYQLKCVKLYGMDYAIACNRSTKITNRANNSFGSIESTKLGNTEEAIYSQNFNQQRFGASIKNNKKYDIEENDKKFFEKNQQARYKGLKSILIKMYQDALNNKSPSWVFIKRLNFRNNLGKINGEDFNLDKHFVNFYANLHSQDRKAISADFQVILEP
ncbi:hypothetical protein [Campylobacter sp. 2457A]|uniref:hypothetical protein n=1 Tax=Campylobacter sp. 2457A TaxID=2735784 RepID=UPI00301D2606|nr:hypothetical protein [Campylobacter sp. 2457A]